LPAAQRKIVPNGRRDIETKDGIVKWNANTKYKHEYCQQVIDFMSEGMSPAECARAFNVSVKCLHDWRHNFPDFAEAYETALDYNLAYLEGVAREHLVITTYKDGPKVTFDFRTYAHTMATRHGISDRSESNRLTVIMSQDQAELDQAKQTLKNKVQELLSNDR